MTKMEILFWFRQVKAFANDCWYSDLLFVISFLIEQLVSDYLIVLARLSGGVPWQQDACLRFGFTFEVRRLRGHYKML